MKPVNITQRIDTDRAVQARLVLPFEMRQRSRLRAQLDTGEEVGLILERGTLLRGGDCLLADDDRVVEVVAAAEQVSVVESDDPWQLARAAYHLGNRHISLQVGSGWLRYLHDHVLDEMVRGLGFTVTCQQVPFEPEAGAYSHAGAGNSHHHAFVLRADHPHAHD